MKDLSPLKSLEFFENHLPEFLQRKESEDRRIRNLISPLKGALKETPSLFSHKNQLKYGKKLIKHIITKSIEHLSDETNLPADRSIKKIECYIDNFTKFEEMLFGLNLDYRDHTLHSLWVYLFGHQFIKEGMGGYENIKVIGQLYYIYNKVGAEIMVCAPRLKCSKEHLQAMWGMVAILHDLGYPVEAFSNEVHDIFRSVLDPIAIDFSSIFQPDFGSRITLLHQSACDILSALYSPDISIKEIERVIEEYPEDTPNIKLHGLPTITKSEEHEMEFRVASVNKIHSAWSVILAFKNIAYLHSYQGDYKDLMSKKDILYSILHHTDEAPKDKAVNRFQFILILMDDIEEAGRYSKGGKLRGLEVDRCDLRWDVGKDKTIIELDYSNYEKKGDEAEKKCEEMSKKYKYQIEQAGKYEVEIKFISKNFEGKRRLYLGQDKGSAEDSD